MATFIRKLKTLLSARPGIRFTTYCGSNTYDEWMSALLSLFSRNVNNDLGSISEYEEAFAKATGTQNAFSFGAGRMALYAILEALDIGEGDEVIIPAFTCVVVSNAILYRGAKPIYVDIDPATFNIDVTKIEAVITGKTKALYAQHTFGTPCDITTLREIAGRHRLPIIEDGAHALGGSIDGSAVGSLTEVAFFTTDRTKVINTHLGGMAVTNDAVIAKRLKEVQAKTPFLEDSTVRKILLSFVLEHILFSPYVYWIGKLLRSVTSQLGGSFTFTDEMEINKPSAYPYPCRLSSAQAKIGLLQLEKLQLNVGHRQEIAQYLENHIKWNRFTPEEMQKLTWLRYSFLVKDRAAFEERFKKHFDLGIWFTSVLHGRNENHELVAYKKGSCPVAEYAAEHIVNFPTHQRVSLNVLSRDFMENREWIESQTVRPAEVGLGQPR